MYSAFEGQRVGGRHMQMLYGNGKHRVYDAGREFVMEVVNGLEGGYDPILYVLLGVGKRN
jgi:hypothetical protein